MTKPKKEYVRTFRHPNAVTSRMKELNISYTDLSKELGCSRQNVEELVANRGRYCSIEYAKRICEILDVKVMDVFDLIALSIRLKPKAVTIDEALGAIEKEIKGDDTDGDS